MTAVATGAYTIEYRIIPEVAVAGRPLGRHVRHDSRSLNYRVEPVAAPVSVEWNRRTPTLDQASTSACTGNAMVGCLGTEPFYSSLTAKLQAGLKLDESEALSVYALATSLDSYAGTFTYPPPGGQDTGSDGLSVMQAAKSPQFELISGYTHALSIDDVIAGLQKGPGITGTNWLTDMDNPSNEGIIKYSGSIRGGHEYEVWKVDLERGLIWFWNSWGDPFGLGGRFAMSLEDYAKALKDQGDATFPIPITQPAPVPTPTPPGPPAPAPTPPGPPSPDDPRAAADAAYITDADPWAGAPHFWRRATVAAKAYKIWRATR